MHFNIWDQNIGQNAISFLIIEQPDVICVMCHRTSKKESFHQQNL